MKVVPFMTSGFRRAVAAFATAVILTGIIRPAVAQQSALPTIAEKTQGLARKGGYLPLYWDARAGKVWLEIPLGEAMIFQTYLPWGVGSNDIGLDRGPLG